MLRLARTVGCHCKRSEAIQALPGPAQDSVDNQDGQRTADHIAQPACTSNTIHAPIAPMSYVMYWGRVITQASP